VLPETRHLRLHSVMANIPMAILASALQAKITTAFPARCRVTA
jgi:transcriptional regulator of aromatic amino acid metabolism